MICSGGKSTSEAKTECSKFCKIVKKLGYKVELKDFKIHNIIMSYDVQFKISLNDLYDKLKNLKNKNNNNYVRYNKEIFPCVIFYFNDFKINLTFFESGKVILSGGKKIKDIEDVFRGIYQILIETRMINCNEDEK